MIIALSISYVKAPDVIPTAATISPTSPPYIVPVPTFVDLFCLLKKELTQLLQQRLQAMHKITLISLRLEIRYL